MATLDISLYKYIRGANARSILWTLIDVNGHDVLRASANLRRIIRDILNKMRRKHAKEKFHGDLGDPKNIVFEKGNIEALKFINSKPEANKDDDYKGLGQLLEEICQVTTLRGNGKSYYTLDDETINFKRDLSGRIMVSCKLYIHHHYWLMDAGERQKFFSNAFNRIKTDDKLKNELDGIQSALSPFPSAIPKHTIFSQILARGHRSKYQDNMNHLITFVRHSYEHWQETVQFKEHVLQMECRCTSLFRLNL
ncbi:hypothetical protein FRX31_006271 [Thalictrum thalictroides]|uniref:Uncharacterized protein n=1 Tax=Thalictrum thalictroides TaxID=46969 RepID=A0A7J6X6Z9_THATH|nr:hypothetical protein FRX31_006271 [Thalictrum thalictroides]